MRLWVGLRHVCPGQGRGENLWDDLCRFSYTTLFQLCENKMTFLLQK